MQLLACPLCLGSLIYAIDIAGIGRDVVLARRCPECEYRDSVVTTATAAAVWFNREARTSAELSRQADLLKSAREKRALHAGLLGAT